jgi:hypothetical protein
MSPLFGLQLDRNWTAIAHFNPVREAVADHRFAQTGSSEFLEMSKNVRFIRPVWLYECKAAVVGVEYSSSFSIVTALILQMK